MSKPYKVVFLGTPPIAADCLKALSQNDNFQIVGVVSQPDRPAGRKMQLQPSAVKKVAHELGFEVMTPENVNAPEAMEQLKAWNGDCAVVVAFGQLMKQPLLDLYPKKIVNVHASLLPRWRGAAPIQQAIIAGDKETGCSLQVMELKLDAGDVIGEIKTPILDSMSALDLLQKMSELGQQLLVKNFVSYLQGLVTPIPQKEELVTYASKLTKDKSHLDFSWAATDLFNFIRGYQMGPGTYFFRDDVKVKVHASEKSSGTHNGTVGQCFVGAEGQWIVNCGSGTQLILKIVQPENKPKMSADDYLRGRPLSDNEVLK